MPMPYPFKTEMLKESYDYLAPDQSEIRLLIQTEKGDIAHCALPPGKTSLAVKHKTINEIWYFLEGEGEVWRKMEGLDEEITQVKPGLALHIPTGAHFQFRNTGETYLKFLITCMPTWPGEEEAVFVEGKWE
jgi:mannose-6-phosphate isomerase-like protein (cupin superfamily)